MKGLHVPFPAILIGLLQSTDHRVQKKCYRILEEMCLGKSDACKKFVSSNLTELQGILLKSLSSSSPSSKGVRKGDYFYHLALHACWCYLKDRLW